MGISEKVCNRLHTAVRRALAENQYGDVHDEKIDDIRDQMVSLLMSMHKDKMLHDYSFSVVGDRMAGTIKIKLFASLTPDSEMMDFSSEVKLRNTSKREDAFDRAMGGI